MFEQFLISVSNDVGTDGEGAEHIPMLLRSDPPSVPTRRQYLLSVVLIHTPVSKNRPKLSQVFPKYG